MSYRNRGRHGQRSSEQEATYGRDYNTRRDDESGRFGDWTPNRSQYGESRPSRFDRDYDTETDPQRYRREQYPREQFGREQSRRERYQNELNRSDRDLDFGGADRRSEDYWQTRARDFGRGSEPGYGRREQYGRENYGRPVTGSYGGTYGGDYDNQGEERGWWERATDAVSSWFGDEEAERRRRTDRARGQSFRGRGPKGYQRSDERIKEDVNDRLTDNDYLDASDITVEVTVGEVILTGTVPDRGSKRLAEEISEEVSGVRNVENRLRLANTSQDQNTLSDSTGTTTPKSKSTTAT